MPSTPTRQGRWATHLHIVRSLWLVTFFLIIGKVAVAFKDIILAYRFGVSELVDIYLVVFLMTSWLPIAWSGVLNYAITTATGNTNAADKRRFFDEMTGLTLCVALVCTLLVLGSVQYFDFMQPPSLSEAGVHNINLLYIGFAPVMFLLFLYARYAAELLSMDKHSNTILDALPPGAVATSLLLGSNFDPVVSIIVASLIGGVAQLAIILLILNRNQVSLGVQFGFQASSWKAFKGAFYLLIAGQILLSFTSPIDLFFASRIGEGNLANYGYAQRIVLFLFSFATIAIMRGFLPTLTKLKHSTNEMKSIVRIWSAGLFVLSVVGVIIGWLLSPTAVSLIYERGAFASENTMVVSRALQIALIQLPFFFSAMVFVQYFASRNSYSVIFKGVLVSVVVKLASALLLVDKFGLDGLMMTSTAMYVATWAYYVYAFFVRTPSSKPLNP